MPDYKNGKIYKIWSPHGDDIYIGSTTQPLYKRLSGHKHNRLCSSKILFEKYTDVKIELIESYPCENKDELNKREGEYIRNNICVNRCVAGRTKQQHYEDNKEKNKEKKKDYRENNKEKINEYNKEYYANNKEKLNEKNKENNKVKYTCECGRIIRIGDKARHERSNFHQLAIGGADAGEDLTSCTAC